MRHSGQLANQSAGIQVLPPPIARQRQAAGTRSAPIPPHCWPGPALVDLVRASYPTSRALATWNLPLPPSVLSLLLCQTTQLQLQLPSRLRASGSALLDLPSFVSSEDMLNLILNA